MKATLKVGDLVEAASVAANTVNSSLENVNIGGLYMRSRVASKDLLVFSSNLTAKTLLKIPANVEADGEVLIKPDKLLSLLQGRGADMDVVLSLNEAKNRLSVKVGRYPGFISARSDTGPVIGLMKALPLKGTPIVSLKAVELAEFCRRGMSAAPPKDGIGFRRGAIYLSTWAEGYMVTATDGNSAVMVKAKTEKKGGEVPKLLISSESLGALLKLLEHKSEENVDIVMGPADEHGEFGEVFFRLNTVMYGGRLLAGDFPDIPAMMERYSSKYEFRANLLELRIDLQRCQAFVDKKNSQVVLSLFSDHMKVSSFSEDGQNCDEVALEWISEPNKGAEVHMFLNPNYLLNALSSTKSSTIQLGITATTEPLAITDQVNGVDARYLVMGMKGTVPK